MGLVAAELNKWHKTDNAPNVLQITLKYRPERRLATENKRQDSVLRVDKKFWPPEMPPMHACGAVDPVKILLSSTLNTRLLCVTECGSAVLRKMGDKF